MVYDLIDSEYMFIAPWTSPALLPSMLVFLQAVAHGISKTRARFDFRGYQVFTMIRLIVAITAPASAIQPVRCLDLPKCLQLYLHQCQEPLCFNVMG